MVGSSQQRSEVWRGIRKKTSGGLTKADLIKNKRGKLVSKKKSQQAGDQNNLGSWLREKGKKIDKAKMLRKKSEPPADAPKKSKKEKPKAAPKPKPKPKPAPKAAPKAAPVAQPKKKTTIVRKKAQAAPKGKKLKKKSNINPLTQQPYEKKAKSGYVQKGALSIDNIKRAKLRLQKLKPSEVDFGKGGW